MNLTALNESINSHPKVRRQRVSFSQESFDNENDNNNFPQFVPLNFKGDVSQLRLNRSPSNAGHLENEEPVPKPAPMVNQLQLP